MFEHFHFGGHEEKVSAPAMGLITLITSYAEAKRNDIQRGADTPRLAALMVLLYGRGIVESAGVLLAGRASGEKSALEPIWKVVEAEASALDPQWREEFQMRLKARPADLQYVERPTHVAPSANAKLLKHMIGEEDAKG